MVYEQIKRRAEQKGITIAEVARRAKVEPTLIGKWRKSSPSVEKAKRIADALECTVDDLISDDMPEDQPDSVPA